jgi:hypothetical protein
MSSVMSSMQDLVCLTYQIENWLCDRVFPRVIFMHLWELRLSQLVLWRLIHLRLDVM